MNEIEEFWNMIHSGDEELREEGFDKWIEFDNKNPLYFENMREKFPKQLYETYKSIILHDFHVLNAEIICDTNQFQKTNIKIMVYDYHEDYDKDLYFHFIYHNVYEYTFNVPDTNGAMSWYGDIFEEVEKHMIKHRIALINDMYIEIVCESVDMVKVNPSI